MDCPAILDACFSKSAHSILFFIGLAQSTVLLAWEVLPRWLVLSLANSHPQSTRLYSIKWTDGYWGCGPKLGCCANGKVSSHNIMGASLELLTHFSPKIFCSCFRNFHIMCSMYLCRWQQIQTRKMPKGNMSSPSYYIDCLGQIKKNIFLNE